MYVNAFAVYVNKCLKPFFLEQHINIVNRGMLQSLWFICSKPASFTLQIFVSLALSVVKVPKSRQNQHHSTEHLHVSFIHVHVTSILVCTKFNLSAVAQW